MMKSKEGEVRHGRGGLVWIDSPYPVVALGLKHALEGKMNVYMGSNNVSEENLSCVVYCTSDSEAEAVSEAIERIRRSAPQTPILVFGMSLDLSLAQESIHQGARGFIHAGMTPEQIHRAVTVASKGEIVAPRQLLEHLLMQEKSDQLGLLTSRQKEILGLVVEGLSNAQIARNLYLSESTVKQHLRAAYKSLGVNNRTEAAKLFRNNGG